MTVLIDVKEIKKKSRVRFFLHIFGIIFLTLGVIAGSLLLLLLSNLGYIPNLILTIVLDATYFSFLVFYFFSIFPIVKHYYKVFGKMNQVAFEHRRRLKYAEEKENRINENVRYRTLCFIYKEGENNYNENLYVLDNNVKFIKDKYYSLFTYQNIILSYEEAKDATV